jgi:hypothetical protein
MPIVIEAESPDNPNSTLRVVAAGVVRGESLTATQAYTLVGEILETLYTSRSDVA